MSAPASHGPTAPSRGSRLWRWAAVIGAGVAIAALPRPSGITANSWNLLAIFVSTVLGLTLQPLPGGAMVLLGMTATTLLGVQPIGKALSGYADPVVWLVLAAFFMSRGMIGTGLGRRIAFLLIRALGRRSLGLGYALALTEFTLAGFIPSNAARAGGIVFPIAKSLATAYEVGARPHRGAARIVPDVVHLPVLRRELRDLPHRTGRQRADRGIRDEDRRLFGSPTRAGLRGRSCRAS